MEVQYRLADRLLHGLDEIACYLRVSRRTVYRWIEDIGLPAMQTPARTWITSTRLIDQWILALSQLQWKARQAEKGKARAHVGTADGLQEATG
jgi:excisionase family DNA binding protein